VTIVRPGVPVQPAAPDEVIVSFDEFIHWLRRGTVLKHIGRHGEGRLLVHRLESAGRPLPLALALRAMSRGRVAVEDVRGRRRPLTGGLLCRWTAQLATEPFRIRALLRSVERAVATIETENRRMERQPPVLNLTASPLYLRTDLSFGVRAGGSVAHISGVLNELDRFTGPVMVLTTDDIPTLKSGVEMHLVPPAEAFWNFRELPTFLLNDAFDAAADATTGRCRPAFVYQRYSLNNYAGLRIARRHRVPFVLEYNGSEIWMGRHWSRPLRHEALARRIELLNLSSADLIVVVSRAMQEEIVARGIDPRSICVNPNGADATRYRPDIDGTPVRERYGLRGMVVAGFTGTFGPWHGAEVLASAFVKLLRDQPALASTVRLLLIGEGAALPAVQRILTDGGAMDAAVLTGLVPFEDIPSFLAACDVLCSPHVANPDGTPFFGSPTKLFEYMAMGRGIVASRLEQIGEVLEHNRTAWLVAPGDINGLAHGLGRLIDDAELRRALGAAARQEVVARYTWRAHTQRVIERLSQVSTLEARVSIKSQARVEM
jgi:glycosyltransferase involved in cell wall biosynthesis